MSYRENGGPEEGRVPTSCIELGNALETLCWVSKALSRLDRIQSCERKNSLKVALESFLEDPHTLPYHQLIKEHNDALSENGVLSREVELLKAKLEQKRDDDPLMFELFRDNPELADRFGNLRFRLISKKWYKALICITVIAVGLCGILIWLFKGAT